MELFTYTMVIDMVFTLNSLRELELLTLTLVSGASDTPSVNRRFERDNTTQVEYDWYYVSLYEHVFGQLFHKVILNWITPRESLLC